MNSETLRLINYCLALSIFRSPLQCPITIDSSTPLLLDTVPHLRILSEGVVLVKSILGAPVTKSTLFGCFLVQLFIFH